MIIRRTKPTRLVLFAGCITTFLLALLFLARNPDPSLATWKLSLGFAKPPPAVNYPTDYRSRLSPTQSCPPPPMRASPSNDTRLARPLSAAELLCRPLETNRTTVPKLFHQSWKTHEVPGRFQSWSDSCREQHPDWEWVLWSDDDNLALVRRYFPHLEDAYHALPHNIYRADLVRNLYMYIFGGVYADLDMECLRPTGSIFNETLLRSSDTAPLTTETNQSVDLAIFGRMGKDPSFKHSIPNAWMAATPGHSFFLLPVERVHREYRKSRLPLHQIWYFWPGAEAVTGPIALRKSITEYSASDSRDGRVVTLPGQFVYPYDWKGGKEVWDICSAESKTFDDQLCKDILGVEGKGSISITYWSHTWG